MTYLIISTFQLDQLFAHRHVPPTPRGLEATSQLEDFPFYSDYRPCVMDWSDQYHYPDTVVYTCRRGFAVFSEVRCQVHLRQPSFYSFFCHFHGENKVILKFL